MLTLVVFLPCRLSHYETCRAKLVEKLTLSKDGRRMFILSLDIVVCISRHLGVQMIVLSCELCDKYINVDLGC